VTSGSILIFVGDVSDVEAHVVAQYVPTEADHSESSQREPVVMHGALRGPFCEHARTLPAEFHFRDLGSAETGRAKAIVPDPCMWSHDLPHLYRADVEARRGNEIVAEYHGMIGFRRAVEKNV
jgi:hypothetical protein